MELKQVETFVSIMKEGSFAEAARRLGYAQSSVTAHVRLLEESLAVRLFEKRSRLNVPTEAALSFLPYAREMIDLSRNARNAMLATSGRMESKVVVAASEAALMSDALKKFIEDYPQTELTIKVCLCREIPGLVNGGEADLGFFIGESAIDPEKNSILRLIAARKMETVLAGAPGQGPLFIKENIRTQRFVCARGEGLYRKIAEKAFRLWGIDPQIVEAGSVPAIKELCMAGLGLALLPRVSVARECAVGALRADPWDADGKFFHPELKLVVHRNKTLTPAMTELCTRLSEALSKI